MKFPAFRSVLVMMRASKNIKEIGAVLAVFLCMAVLNWRLLFSRELIATHDSVIWYGVFSYFADCLLNGCLPLWNPYMNCGEPFFLNIYTLHLLDPSTLFLIFTGSIFKIDLLTLYHWDLFLRYLIFTCGSYLFFRSVAENKASAFIAFLSIAFSSLFTSYLRQHAFILTFYLFPWVLLFSLKFLEKRNPGLFFVFAFLFGIVMLSYHSVFVLFALVFLLLCLRLTNGLPPLNFKSLFKTSRVLVISSILFFLLIFNLWPVFLQYKYDVVPTVRMFEAPTAACSFPADFLVLVAPYTFITHFFNWNYISESFLYIGLFPLLLALLGLQFSRHKYKWGFVFASAILVFLMMGMNYFIYPMLCKIMPFFKIIRNTHTFSFVFIFYLGYFVCLGADVVFHWVRRSRVRFYMWPLILYTGLIMLLAWMANTFIIQTFPRLIQSYQILYGYNAPLTDDMAGIIVNYFFKSKLNILFFAITSTSVFSLLMPKKPKISFSVKYFAIIAFIFVDLLLYHFSVYGLVTKSRKDIHIPPVTKPVYQDNRQPVIMPVYPFYGFYPAMNKTGTAYSTKWTWITTHFYETKDYYDLLKDKKIPGDVRDVFMGITAPKLRLFSGAVVLPRAEIAAALRNLKEQDAHRVIFVEEEFPQERLFLKKSLNAAITQGLDITKDGNINVSHFDINSIVIDTMSKQDSILYYSDGFDKAWKVFVDGKPQKVYKANLAFKAVVILMGHHKVRFVYVPWLYIFSLWCYMAGLLSLSVIGILKIKEHFFKKQENKI